MRARLHLQGRPGPQRSRDRGASAVEYALLATGVAMTILLAVLFFGGGVNDLFETVCIGDGC
jgi:Flp pilus assembly pilin Flp